MDFTFDNSFHGEMEGFYAPAKAVKPSAAALLALLGRAERPTSASTRLWSMDATTRPRASAPAAVGIAK